MTDGDETDLDDFRSRATTGSRIEQAASDVGASENPGSETDTAGAASPDEPLDSQTEDWNLGDGDELVDALEASIESVEGNDKVISVWDEQFAAVLDTLEEHPHLVESPHDELQEALSSKDGESSSRSEIIRIILYAGLNETVPGIKSALQEVVKRQAVADL